MLRTRYDTTHSISWWTARKDSIDLEPPYQRKPGRWSKEAQGLLVDSIINGYDLPKFYFADLAQLAMGTEKARARYAVIDGKQRLEAIFAFADNHLSLNSNFVYFDEPDLPVAGHTYLDLKRSFPSLAARFDDYILPVVLVVTENPAEINNLFLRLNTNMVPLVGAERRNAFEGLVPQLVRQIAKHPFFRENIRFSVRASQDRNVAAKLLLIEFSGRLVETKKRQLDRFAEAAARIEVDESDLQRAAGRVTYSLDSMHRVFQPKDPLLRSEGPITLYYWLIRNTIGNELKLIRDFLLAFEEVRSRAREAQVGDDSIDLDPEVLLYDRLNRDTNDARSLEIRYSILHRRLQAYVGSGVIVSSTPLEGDIRRELVALARREPRGALVRAYSLLEQQVRIVASQLGVSSDTRAPLLRLAQQLVQRGSLPATVLSSVDLVRSLRNRFVHETGPLSDEEALTGVDAATSLLRLLDAVERETYRVVDLVPVYRDADAQEPVSEVRAVVLDVSSAGGSQVERRIYPTTISYVPGTFVGWSWNMQRVFPRMWWRSPDGSVRVAWESSAEFIGRPLSAAPVERQVQERVDRVVRSRFAPYPFTADEVQVLQKTLFEAGKNLEIDFDYGIVPSGDGWALRFTPDLGAYGVTSDGRKETLQKVAEIHKAVVRQLRGWEEWSRIRAPDRSDDHDANSRGERRQGQLGQ